MRSLSTIKIFVTYVFISFLGIHSFAQETYNTDTVAYSLSVEDVTVTAKSVGGASNIQKLNQTAIQHQQTSSVADLMQLLPGVLTENPNLNSQSQITIRDTKNNQTNQIGVAIIADGVDLNADANLQKLSTNSSSNYSDDESALKGADLRPLSTDAIESMTVIRGVAPAEYGNMTSGAVVIKYNNRPRPLSFVLKTDPRLKSLSAEYGYSHINANVDYAISQNDVRSTTSKFQRIGLRVAYNRTFGIATVSSTANLHLSNNINKTDPDIAAYQKITHTDRSISWSNKINLRATNTLIPLISIEAIGKMQWQKDDTETTHIAEMPTPYTNSTIEGNNPGYFYPTDFIQNTFIHGQPVSGQIKISLRKAIGSESLMNSVSMGAHLNMQRNFGEGKGGNYLPYGVRPRKFSDIPHLGSSAFFAEEKITINGFQGQFGIRLTHINAPEYSFSWQVEPRLSAKYEIAKPFSLSASWGIMKKLPTLLHLYPDPAYADYLTSATSDTNGNRQCTFSTHKIMGNSNPNLKLPSTNNFEFTATSVLPKATVTVTYYNESLTNGYDFKKRVEPYRVETAKPDTTFAQFQTPRNNIKHDKWGIEYVIDFAKIRPLNLSIYLDGAYQNISRYDTETEETYTADIINGRLRKYAARILSTGSYNTTKSERLNTNVRFIVHIPRFALVASIKAQGVWIDKSSNKAVYNGNNMSQRNESDGRIFVNPIALISQDGNSIAFSDHISQGQSYVKYTTSTALKTNNPKPYGQLDFKITKEIASRAQFSLFVNNITNLRPKRYMASSDTYIYKNTETYFGCDLRVKI